MNKFFNWFRSFCVTSFPFVAFVLVVVNFFVSFFVYKSSHPRYYYRCFVITNEVVSVVTSVIPSSVSSPVSSSLPSASSSSPSSNPPPVYPVRYEYMLLSGFPCARLFGRVYYEGDFTSRGMILRIFPDRIVLHNGSSFENVGFSSDRSQIRKDL